MNKTQFREKAIALRQLGHSYPEILQEIPIVKSTLWMWLKDVELCDEARRVIKERRVRNQVFAVELGRTRRRERTEKIQNQAKSEVGKLSEREFWLVGAALYWAEGMKEKDYSPGSRVAFSNSDPQMVLFFRTWLLKACKVSPDDIVYDLTIHELSKERSVELLGFWSGVLRCDWDKIRVHYKGWVNPSGTNRHKRAYDYKGMFRLCVRRSSGLVRRLSGWAKGITGEQ